MCPKGGFFQERKITRYDRISVGTGTLFRSIRQFLLPSRQFRVGRCRKCENQRTPSGAWEGVGSDSQYFGEGINTAPTPWFRKSSPHSKSLTFSASEKTTFVKSQKLSEPESKPYQIHNLYSSPTSVERTGWRLFLMGGRKVCALPPTCFRFRTRASSGNVDPVHSSMLLALIQLDLCQLQCIFWKGLKNLHGE